ncbi:MAG: SemiSWEET transporter [Cyanobacteriota bacterium]|nr:SemiSWEET transporter [Cyanobacteriota bacterium]
MPHLAIKILGYLAACLTTISFFPQAFKTLRSGETRGISLGMYGLFTGGVGLWAIYGMLISDGPLIAANLITLVPAGFVLAKVIRR